MLLKQEACRSARLGGHVFGGGPRLGCIPNLSGSRSARIASSAAPAAVPLSDGEARCLGPGRIRTSRGDRRHRSHNFTGIFVLLTLK